MTFSVVPFALQNSSHSAEVFRQAVSSLVPPGGGLVTAGDLAVTQTGTPSMNVSIGVGRIWIPGTNVGNVTGGNFSSQAMYYGQNTSAYTASVTTSDPINPRIDVVYAAIEDSQYAGISNTGKLAVVAGVPISGATYPANAPAIPSNAKALAWLLVPANAPSIVNANITAIPNQIIGRLPIGQLATVTNGGSNIVGTALNSLLEASVYVAAGRRIEVRAAIDGSASVNGLYCSYTLAQGGTGTGGDALRTSTKAYAAANLGEGFEFTARYTTTAAATLRFSLRGQVTITSGTMTATAGNTRLTITDVGAA